MLFIGSSIQAFGQNDSLETETAFMECLYNLSSDNGKEFKVALQKATQKLIDKNILKDDSGASYVALYKNLEKVEDSELKNLGIGKQIISLQQNIDADEMNTCMKNVLTSPKYADSKLNKFLQYTASIDENASDMQVIIDKLLTILDAKDLEHDYYKMTTFLMIETINNVDVDGIVTELPKDVEQTFTEAELERALKIEIDAEGTLFVNGEKTPLKKLKKTVITYTKEQKAKSVFLFMTSKQVAYKTFIVIQNEIVSGLNTVRDQLAKTTFNRSFDELTEAEKEEIKKTYPLKIKETITDE